MRSHPSLARAFVVVPAILIAVCAVGPQAAAASQFRAEPDAIKAGARYDRQGEKSGPAADPLVAVVLKYDAAPLASYEGGVGKLLATSPAKTGARIDLRSERSRAYMRHLALERQRVERAARAIAPGVRIGHHLSVVVGGVAMQVPRSQLDGLRRIPGVTVLADELLKPVTYRSPEFIGATTAWAQAGGPQNAGEGVIVGILDSGIWPEQPSFADPGPSGKAYPAPPARWTGTVCDFGKAGGPTDAAFTCNNKLVGARRSMGTYETLTGLRSYEFRSARDDDGHGSHTASTAAGNSGVVPTISGNSSFGSIAGIAPRAHVAAYKVCGERGCYGSDSAAAVQQAILDGVDVLNFSISGGNNPYSDVVSLAFLDAYNAGVFVAASAGNSGPGANTVNHRAPWITTVAASTHDRSFLNQVYLAGSAGTLSLTGASITGVGVPSAVPAVVNSGDALCLTPAAPGSFAGKIVVCQRGVNARVAKSANVAAGGAVGMILYNTSASSLDLDSHSIPTSHIDHIAGPQLLTFLAANPGATGTMSTGVETEVDGDVIAGFSSRGGTGLTLGALKPDITGPGVAILAGYTGLQYGRPLDANAFLSGTSMSSPHIAGAAALLKQRYPAWTPGQIKSALMTTSTPAVLKEDGITPATPFDTGAGRVNLARATNPGLTFSASGSDFMTHSGNLSIVNQPSIYVPANPGSVTINRAARSTLNVPRAWKVSVASDPTVRVTAPAGFTLGAGQVINLPITIDASLLAAGQVGHARLTLRSTDEVYEATLPISVVRRDGGVVMAKSCTATSLVLGGVTDCQISFTNSTTTTAGVEVRDVLPKQLILKSLSGPSGTRRVNSREFRFSGSLAGGSRETFSVQAGTSPGGGYLPLSGFGVPPIAGVGDETIVNFNVPAFRYNGQTYSRVGVVSNGYVVVGGGTGADVRFINQALPNTAPPNNVLAPFWTDLNPGAGGALRIGTLTDGVSTWLVVEWAAVRNFTDTGVNSFQVWIQTGGAVEDITYAYGPVTTGDGGFLTVGAESSDGVAGASYYVDGTGTAPFDGTQLRVSTTAGTPGEIKTIQFTVEGAQTGSWTNCATLTSSALAGTATGCVSGTVTAAP